MLWYCTGRNGVPQVVFLSMDRPTESRRIGCHALNLAALPAGKQFDQTMIGVRADGLFAQMSIPPQTPIAIFEGTAIGTAQTRIHCLTQSLCVTGTWRLTHDPTLNDLKVRYTLDDTVSVASSS